MGGGRYQNTVSTAFMYTIQGQDRVIKENNRLTQSTKRQTQAKRQNTQANRENTVAQKKNSDAVNNNRHAFGRWLGIGLSTMFLSMQLSMTFSQMLRPVLEMTGVFDVWRATLISVLSPVLVPLSMILIDIMIAFMELPRPVKKMIGWFVVLSWGVSKLLMMFSQIFLLLISIGLPTLIRTGSVILALKSAIDILLVPLRWLWLFLRHPVLMFKTLFQTYPILTKIASVLTVIVGAFKAINGLIKSDSWTTFSGILLVIAGSIAVIFGGWIPAAVAAIGTAISWLGSEFKQLQEIIMTILYPITTLVGSLMALIELVKTGDLGKSMDKYKDVMIGDTLLGRIPGLADGGIVTRPTLAMVGERGPEAVVPLNQEGGGGGQGINININLDNAQFSSRDNMNNFINMVKSALRDELARRGLG